MIASMRAARERTRAPALQAPGTFAISSASDSGFSGLPRARAGSDASVRPSASVMRRRAQRSAGKRAKIPHPRQARSRRATGRRADRDGRRIDFGGADAIEHERRRDAIWQAVLRIIGRRGRRGHCDPRSIASRNDSMRTRDDRRPQRTHACVSTRAPPRSPAAPSGTPDTP